MMRIGKVPESVLLRSVFREIKGRREEVLSGPGIGKDSCVVKGGPDEVFLFSSESVSDGSKNCSWLCVHRSVNNLAASKGRPAGILLQILLPTHMEEADLKMLMRGAEKACEELGIEIMGGHTEVNPAVMRAVVNVTGVGIGAGIKKDGLEESGWEKSEITSDLSLVMTKGAGLEGTWLLAEEKEEMLRSKFSLAFTEQAKGLRNSMSVLREAQIAWQEGAVGMHDLSEGGVFGGLWELAQGSGVGLDIDLRKIPIRQETVEVCEYFGLNPYQIRSGGSLLIAVEDGEKLVQRLDQEGISAAVIGRTTNGKERMLHNREEIRFLDKPQMDEIYKILQKEV